MSGDLGLRSSIPASLAALREDPQLDISLVGDADVIRAELRTCKFSEQRLHVVPSQSVVGMDDKPSVAVRKKRDSSMAIALTMLKDNQVNAVVSAGNTGALVAMGSLMVRRLPGIRRPAICAPIPSRQGHTLLLDLGANIDSSPLELYQFAVMGSALASVLDGRAAPRVALLNMGEEELKGKDLLRDTAELIRRDSGLNYVGFVEGDDIFGAEADVIVCEGFVGNVALKVCEGTAHFIGQELKKEFAAHWYGPIVGLAARTVLRSFLRRIDPERYNGAALLGLAGVVVKSHGGSGATSFQAAIRQAALAARRDLPRLIAEHAPAPSVL